MHKQVLFGNRATLEQYRPYSIIVYSCRVSSPVLSCYCRIASSHIFRVSLSSPCSSSCPSSSRQVIRRDAILLIFGYATNIHCYKPKCITEAEKGPQQKAKTYCFPEASWLLILFLILQLARCNMTIHCSLSGYFYLLFL